MNTFLQHSVVKNGFIFFGVIENLDKENNIANGVISEILTDNYQTVAGRYEAIVNAFADHPVTFSGTRIRNITIDEIAAFINENESLPHGALIIPYAYN